MLVLVTDVSGTPKEWVDFETAACYYVKEKVTWESGNIVRTFHGGLSALTGDQSKLDISSIIGVSGPVFGDDFKRGSMYPTRSTLYARDKHICGYCGYQFHPNNLTKDHIIPSSRGGKDTWTNIVSACYPCNNHKANRTPEEANMQLLYVPYVPNIYERMILANRKIITDQMEYLARRVPKNSRLFS